MLTNNRDRKLLRAIARYQTYRDRRDILSRLKCMSGKMGHMVWSLLSASDIHRDAQIAADTRMPHPMGIVVHAGAVIEPGCLIMQHVTVGQLADGGAPYIEKGAYLGAGARVLGPIRIGAGARIGANAVVLKDVPPGATAVGVPARIIPTTAIPDRNQG